jgi:hypothetical protein
VERSPNTYRFAFTPPPSSTEASVTNDPYFSKDWLHITGKFERWISGYSTKATRNLFLSNRLCTESHTWNTHDFCLRTDWRTESLPPLTCCPGGGGGEEREEWGREGLAQSQFLRNYWRHHSRLMDIVCPLAITQSSALSVLLASVWIFFTSTAPATTVTQRNNSTAASSCCSHNCSSPQCCHSGCCHRFRKDNQTWLSWIVVSFSLPTDS